MLTRAGVTDMPATPTVDGLYRDIDQYGRTVRVEHVDMPERRVSYTTVTTTSGQPPSRRRSTSMPLHQFSRRYTPIPEGAAPCPEL
jgi:hypothetical protein